MMRNKYRYISGISTLTLSIAVIWFISFSDRISFSSMAGIAVVNLLTLIVAAELTDIFKDKYRNVLFSYALTPVIKTLILHLIALAVVAIFAEKYSRYFLFLLVSIALFYLIEIIYTIKITYNTRKLERGELNLRGSSGNSETELSRYDIKSFQKTVIISSGMLLKGIGNEEKDYVSRLLANVKSENKTDRNEFIFPLTNEKMGYIEYCSVPFNNLKDINGYLADIYNTILPLGFLVIHYNPISENQGRKISKAEVWGRLHFSGFEVLYEIQIDNFAFITAQKQKKLTGKNNPSCYPVIKLKRVGYLGKIINVYKLRSMYPYSEFIQKKVFELNQLNNSGKIKSDFRITPLGKILRKYWIDELPQIINWIKGDIKLVGIRAMSLHYFSLYPDYYKENYCRVKPGLIPPIFDDRERSFGEIKDAEMVYLEKYIKSPFKTDFQYLVTTLHDIIFKGIRGK